MVDNPRKMVVSWSGTITASTKKRIKDIGAELEKELHKVGIFNHYDINDNRTKASRVVARVFGGSLIDLIDFSQKKEMESIPDLDDIIKGEDN